MHCGLGSQQSLESQRLFLVQDRYLDNEALIYQKLPLLKVLTCVEAKQTQSQPS